MLCCNMIYLVVVNSIDAIHVILPCLKNIYIYIIIYIYICLLCCNRVLRLRCGPQMDAKGLGWKRWWSCEVCSIFDQILALETFGIGTL